MTTALITRARDLVKELAQSDKEDCVTVTNTLSFDRLMSLFSTTAAR